MTQNFKLYIENPDNKAFYEADVYQSDDILLTQAISSLGGDVNINKVYSLELRIVSTPQVEFLYKYKYRFDVQNKSSLKNPFNARLIVEGVDVLEGSGSIVITNINTDVKKGITIYDCVITSSKYTIFKLFESTTLCSLDLSTPNTTVWDLIDNELIETSIQNNFVGVDSVTGELLEHWDYFGAAFAPINYGGIHVQNGYFDYTHLRPHVYIRKLLQGLERKHNYKFIGDFVNSDFFKRLVWVYQSNPEEHYYTEEQKGQIYFKGQNAHKIGLPRKIPTGNANFTYNIFVEDTDLKFDDIYRKNEGWYANHSGLANFPISILFRIQYKGKITIKKEVVSYLLEHPDVFDVSPTGRLYLKVSLFNSRGDYVSDQYTVAQRPVNSTINYPIHEVTYPIDFIRTNDTLINASVNLNMFYNDGIILEEDITFEFKYSSPLISRFPTDVDNPNYRISLTLHAKPEPTDSVPDRFIWITPNPVNLEEFNIYENLNSQDSQIPNYKLFNINNNYDTSLDNKYYFPQIIIHETNTLEIIPHADKATIYNNASRSLSRMLSCTDTGLDVIKSLEHLFDLLIEVDNVAQTIKMIPRKDYYIKTDGTEDLSEQVDINSEISQDLLYDQINRKVKFKYKEDSNDELVKYLTDIYKRDYQSAEVTLSVDFNDETTILENSVLAPLGFYNDVLISESDTPLPMLAIFHEFDVPDDENLLLNDMNTGNSVFVSLIPDKATYEYAPRIAYMDGLDYKNSNYDLPRYWVNRFDEVGQVRRNFPLMYMVSPYSDVSLAFDDKTHTYETQGLVRKYHFNKLVQLVLGVKVTFISYLRPQQFSIKNFRKIKYLQIPGMGHNYFTLDQITDYTPSKKKAVIELMPYIGNACEFDEGIQISISRGLDTEYDSTIFDSKICCMFLPFTNEDLNKSPVDGTRLVIAISLMTVGGLSVNVSGAIREFTSDDIETFFCGSDLGHSNSALTDFLNEYTAPAVIFDNTCSGTQSSSFIHNTIQFSKGIYFDIGITYELYDEMNNPLVEFSPNASTIYINDQGIFTEPFGGGTLISNYDCTPVGVSKFCVGTVTISEGLSSIIVTDTLTNKTYEFSKTTLKAKCYRETYCNPVGDYIEILDGSGTLFKSNFRCFDIADIDTMGDICQYINNFKIDEDLETNVQAVLQISDIGNNQFYINSSQSKIDNFFLEGNPNIKKDTVLTYTWYFRGSNEVLGSQRLYRASIYADKDPESESNWFNIEGDVSGFSSDIFNGIREVISTGVDATKFNFSKINWANNSNKITNYYNRCDAEHLDVSVEVQYIPSGNKDESAISISQHRLPKQESNSFQLEIHQLRVVNKQIFINMLTSIGRLYYDEEIQEWVAYPITEYGRDNGDVDLSPYNSLNSPDFSIRANFGSALTMNLFDLGVDEMPDVFVSSGNIASGGLQIGTSWSMSIGNRNLNGSIRDNTDPCTHSTIYRVTEVTNPHTNFTLAANTRPMLVRIDPWFNSHLGNGVYFRKGTSNDDLHIVYRQGNSWTSQNIFTTPNGRNDDVSGRVFCMGNGYATFQVMVNNPLLPGLNTVTIYSIRPTGGTLNPVGNWEARAIVDYIAPESNYNGNFTINYDNVAFRPTSVYFIDREGKVKEAFYNGGSTLGTSDYSVVELIQLSNFNASFNYASIDFDPKTAQLYISYVDTSLRTRFQIFDLTTNTFSVSTSIGSVGILNGGSKII